MKTGKLTIKNFNGGWINDFTKQSFSVPQNKPYTYHTGLANFLKSGYVGKPSDGINANTNELISSYGMPVDATIDSAGIGYFLTDTGYIIPINVLGGSFGSITSAYTAASGVSVVDSNKSCWVHIITSGGVSYEAVMYTYTTGGTSYLATLVPSSMGLSNLTFLTLANASAPHVGCVSVLNKSYVTNGDQVRAYDPNGTGNIDLNLGKGWTARSICDYGNYVAIVGNKGETQSRLWLWDGTADFPNFQYDIRDSYVSAVINEGGVLKCITRGKNGTIKIKSFSGNNFDEEADFEFPISALGINSYLMPSHQQVDIWMNQIVFRVGESIYTYGTPKKSEISSGFHKVGTITSDANYRYGCLRNLYNSYCYVGTRHDSENRISYFNSDGPNIDVLLSNIQTARYRLPHKSTITNVKIYFDNYIIFYSGTSSQFEFNLYKDTSTTPIITESIPTTVSTDTRIYEYPINKSIPDVDEFYMKFNYNGCVISQVEVYYSFDSNEA